MPPDPSPDRTPGAARRNPASSGKEALYVVMRNLRWHVVRPDDAWPLSVHDRRDDAILAARAFAAPIGAEVLVFDLGGKPLDPGPPLSQAG
jgi:hypothetical protein